MNQPEADLINEMQKLVLLRQLCIDQQKRVAQKVWVAQAHGSIDQKTATTLRDMMKRQA